MEYITLYLAVIPFLLFIFYYIYFKISQFTKIITIKQKYKKTKNGFESYIIHDTNNNRYLFDTCIWKLHLDHIKLWNSLKENNKYEISGYGFSCESMYMNYHVLSAKINNIQ